MRGVVIAIHDVTPSSLPRIGRLRERVEDMAAGPVSLLVVPRHRGRETWRAGPGGEWLRSRARAGDELVMHGYTHLDRAGRDGSELRGRAPAAITDLIGDGLDELAACGLGVDGFIAPSYLHGRSADAALRDAGLGWWATRGSLRSRHARRHLPSIGLGASTRTRRAMSPAVAGLAARAVAAVPVVRLDLHPADLGHPRLDVAVTDLLERLLSQGRPLVTHAAVVAAG